MKKILLTVGLCFFFAQLAHAKDALLFGTTFSAKQCAYLGLDWKQTYLKILDLPLDVIRLGAYWDQIEEKEGKFDFLDLDWQIEQAGLREITVILSVGMKAPRWPEYHFPSWVKERVKPGFGSIVSTNEFLRQKTLQFTEKVVRRYRDNPSVKYWQIENEALNRFGGKQWRLQEKFLEEEIALVRRIDPQDRPIILTAASYPNNFLRVLSKIFTNTKPIRENLKLADILGINVYPMIGHRGWGRNWYFGSRRNARLNHLKEIFDMAQKSGKDIWITELQAEPWEPGHLAYTKKDTPPTGWPQTTEQTLEELHRIGYKTFLFWGAEFWYYQQKKFNNPTWWDAIDAMITKYKRQTLHR